MKKTKNLAVVLAAAVAICFALVSLLQSAPPDWVDPGPKPIWDVTGANWVEATNPRFCFYDPGTPENNLDDVVLDKETRLTWTRVHSPTRMTWTDAMRYCWDVSAGNRMGWRVPSFTELRSLLAPDAFAPAIPAGHPFIGLGAEFLWTTTRHWNDPGDPGDPAVWVIEISVHNAEGTLLMFDDVDQAYTLCVRGGNGYDGF